jgi:pSer/pThr/pTyr-binding forkhead associated (FHA) protein
MDDSRTSAAVDFVPLRLRLHPGNHIIDLTNPDVLLGRQGDVDLRMPQPDVSREHCRFQFNHGGWRIVDLNSLNGVYVNGARIRRMAVIHSGDQIRICGIEFDVEGPVNAVPVDGPSGVLQHVPATMPHQTIQRKAG